MFSATQLALLALLERLGGCISLAFCLLIFVTYGSIRRLRNPRNTFIVFASIANVGASIGCIIARDGLARGEDSVLCRTQSFMVHIFMQSDAWWSLGMSVNTFMIVFFRSNPHTFHKWLYSLVCFGGPFITGFTLFFISTPARGPAYGATTVWCWIREEWASIRLFTSYFFVWVCIAASIILNTIVGYRLFRTRNRVQHISNSRSGNSAADNPTLARTNSSPYSLGTEDTKTVKTQRITEKTKRAMSRLRLKDPIKRAYLFTTFAFTLSVLVTWVPASINRIHSLLGREVPYSYQIAMVTVMPLQGLWNALIFLTTSYSVLRDIVREKWGLWVLKSTTIDGDLVERDAARGTSAGEDVDPTDSGSDVELRYLPR